MAMEKIGEEQLDQAVSDDGDFSWSWDNRNTMTRSVTYHNISFDSYSLKNLSGQA